MFLFSMLLFFVLTCFCAWLLLFPAVRELVMQSIGALGGRIGCRLRGGYRQGVQQAAGLGREAGGGARRTLSFLRRRYPLLLAALVLVTVPPLLALMLSGRGMLSGYDNDTHAINDQIAGLLQGEQLAAPPAPPPLVFTTAEVTLVRPMLDSANRNWQLLDPAYAQRLLLVFRMMKERHGYDMAILEGYRSPERQNALAAAGPSVTNAKAFQSYHQFGLAADCAFLRDGKLVISEKDPWAMRGYQLYGAAAEAAGLTWGGRWTMMDFGHTELRVPNTVKK
ncbi:peptidoglycan L-alanyl-D-glutamate endopeptidase CwlK [Duganella sp. 1224]|uniref:M15 family metallopeptidase n=1 Tax=Duganella sp. 1224 TaxID=2587052 RepID=UPI0015C6C452|nr:M15 family metallopeptidase [Duganella sp. 1224]NYE59089.1 peptidoglycan L-alanyl-D-glutamate endopeptidase CwlK [Duganella sp. 1224]